MNLITPKSGDEYCQFVSETEFLKTIKQFESKFKGADLYVFAPDSLKEVFRFLLKNTSTFRQPEELFATSMIKFYLFIVFIVGIYLKVMLKRMKKLTLLPIAK